MSNQPRKRARANTTGDVAPAENNAIPQYDLAQAINSMTVKTLRELLAKAATESPSVADDVRQAHHEMVLLQANRAVDFDHYSKSVWREINTKYRSMSGSRQYEAAFDAYAVASKAIKDIAKQVAKHSNFSTKQSALATLRKIGKTVCLSEDTIGHEVRKQFQCDELPKAMLRVIGTMDRTELARMGTNDFLAQLEELVELSESYCVHEGMGEVLEALQPGE